MPNEDNRGRGQTPRDVLYKGSETTVYRTKSESDYQSVIIKVLHGGSSRDALTRLRHEHQILSRLELDGVVQVLGFEKVDNNPAMKLEDCGGEPLSDLIEREGTPLDRVLDIGIQLAGILDQLHARKVIHRDINPNNILWCPESGQVKVIDFGLATLIPEQQEAQSSPNALVGTLAYLSPEQTGRMNRKVDYRTDYYSFGATLYHLATGRPPFRGMDAAELVHCHIAKVPPGPDTIRPEVPFSLSRIILKLLSKNAEDRYQSGRGIRSDLERCRNEMKGGEDSNFPLGMDDTSDRFQLPQKLYVREEEIESLTRAFSAATIGQKTLMMVAGYSGVGKTSLVREIYKSITRKRGYFITGKFDQYKRDIPYGALIEAFQGLVRDLLSEGEAQRTRWKDRLLDALDPNGQVIIDLIPDLELIIGPQPEVPELPPAETRNRLNIVFHSFISVFTREDHPLVIFLDDLQWVDSASLALSQMLLSGPGNPYFLAIGAYRDNEVDPAHPLLLTLKEIESSGLDIGRVELKPLEPSHVQQFVADTLRSDTTEVESLANIVVTKTGGNPFFMGEFIKTLHKEELVWFHAEERRWQWDLGGIEHLGVTDNVVDLMTAKIEKLDPDTQQAVQLAACIGNRFDLPVLANACGKSTGEVMKSLGMAVTEGLLFFLDEAHKYVTIEKDTDETGLLDPVLLETVHYKFAHDKIQQAAYSLIPVDVRTTVHWQIGQHLLKKTPESQQDQVIFDIVNQLNEGRDRIRSEEEKVDLATLNLAAGRKAKGSVAFQSGNIYVGNGLALLDGSWWKDHYTLALDLHNEAAELAYLVTSFSEMERLAEVVKIRAASIHDQLRVYEIRIQACIGQNKQQEAVQMALPVLDKLGISLPFSPSKARVAMELVRLKTALAGKRIERLLEQPEMTDQRVLAIMRIGSGILSASYMVSPNLFPLLALRLLRLSVKYGTTHLTPFVYAVYAMLLCGFLGQVDLGSAFGAMSLKMQERFNYKRLESRLLFANAAVIRHYKERLQDILPMLRNGVRTGLEVGDLEYVAASAAMHGYFTFFMGKELNAASTEMDEFAAVLRQLDQTSYENYHDTFRQVCRNLLGQSPDPRRIVGEVFDESVIGPALEKSSDWHGFAVLHVLKCFVSFLFGDYREAVAAAEVSRKYLESIMGMLPSEASRFYGALARLGHLRSLHSRKDVAEYRLLKRRVRSDIRRLKHLARHSPDTYLHRPLLVQADFAAFRRKKREAASLFDRSIQIAGEHDFLQDEAIASETAARFYLESGNEKIAGAYLQDARFAYEQWGAVAKIEQLDEAYPNLLVGRRRHSRRLTESSPTSSSSQQGASADVDLTTVLKAAQALSSTIHLPRLLEIMMGILIENAGARRGVLILETDGDLMVEAEAVTDSEATEVLQHLPLRSFKAIPHGIVNYVLQTRKAIVLDDAPKEGNFTREAYFQESPVPSVLCNALLYQNKLIGILYLENDLSTGAFTPERVGVLKMLASQMAVSLENARLYDDLEKNNRELDQRVNERTKKLKEAHTNLSIEQRKTDALLLNVLPGRVAGDLKERGATEPESFENVTVMLTDLVDFTTQSSRLEPKVLIGELNELFTSFDNIIEKNHCERIKTIGDAYLSVCGMPEENPRHAECVVQSAWEILGYLEARNRDSTHQWQIRIGVHTGRVVGGVVGIKKYIYDVFGDTINTAARMESHSLPMRINVSQSTYVLTRDRFEFEARDPVEVKGKGMMDMYLLKNPAAEKE